MHKSTNYSRESSKRSLGSDASFMVRVIFRKGANWQGEVHWLETNQKRSFRSSLELMKLMEEAMDEAGAPEPEFDYRTWDEGEEERYSFKNE